MMSYENTRHLADQPCDSGENFTAPGVKKSHVRDF
jgi:hypothetical protein